MWPALRKEQRCGVSRIRGRYPVTPVERANDTRLASGGGVTFEGLPSRASASWGRGYRARSTSHSLPPELLPCAPPRPDAPGGGPAQGRGDRPPSKNQQTHMSDFRCREGGVGTRDVRRSGTGRPPIGSRGPEPLGGRRAWRDRGPKWRGRADEGWVLGPFGPH